IAVLLFWIYRVNYPLQLSGIVYLVVIFVVVLYYWKSPIPRWNLFSASIIFGFIVYVRAIREIIQLTPLWPGVTIGLLSTGIITISTFLFVSIVWNKIKRNGGFSLIPSILKTLIILIGIRLVWDLIILFITKIGDQNGTLMSVYQFFMQNVILYFSLIILFGLIIPLIVVFIWIKQVKAADTKGSLLLSISLLIIIWFSEFLFKYFLLQYGIVL
ncbi:hypothetical protein KKF86_01050, partial [bacterium]|nr:hypothetical protein [bacterium]